MRLYNKVKNDTGDLYPYNAITNAKMVWMEYDKPGHSMQMIRYIGDEKNVEINNLINMAIFKPMSGNTMKQLRIEQETRWPIGTFTISKTTLQKIATEKLQAEKDKM